MGVSALKKFENTPPYSRSYLTRLFLYPFRSASFSRFLPSAIFPPLFPSSLLRSPLPIRFLHPPLPPRRRRILSLFAASLPFVVALSSWWRWRGRGSLHHAWSRCSQPKADAVATRGRNPTVRARPETPLVAAGLALLADHPPLRRPWFGRPAGDRYPDASRLIASRRSRWSGASSIEEEVMAPTEEVASSLASRRLALRLIRQPLSLPLSPSRARGGREIFLKRCP